MSVPFTIESSLSTDEADEEGGQGTRGRSIWRGLRSPKIIIGLSLLGFFVLVAVFGPSLDHADPSATTASILQGPSVAHPLGTTRLGQDVLAQLIVGARDSLLVGFGAAAIATLLALLVGLSGGYLGGLADDLSSVVANAFLVIPALPLVIVLASYLPSTGALNIILVISVTGWAWGARVLRAQTLSIRRRDFVEAARVAGERSSRIIFAEILPNELAIVASTFLFTVIFAILTQSSLAFLGLSDVSSWSWGTMLYWAQGSQALELGAWWWFVPPGLCIALVGMSLALINFGIDEFINPRLRVAGIATKRYGRALRHDSASGGTKGVTSFRGNAQSPSPNGVLPTASSPRRPQAVGPGPSARTPDGAVGSTRGRRDGAYVKTPSAIGTLLSGSSPPVLELINLHVDYGFGDGAVRAVDGVDLVLRRGEVLGLAGESGCGKTTLAFAITRLLRAPGHITEGSVRFHSRSGESLDILRLSDDELRRFRWDQLAIVFQSAMNALNPVLTLRTQIEDTLVAHRPEMNRKARAKHIAELLAIIGISPDRAGAYPHELSGGMRQRGMIAIALALAPDILVMDEPTTALDVVMQRQILAEIMKLRDHFGFSVLFITHDLSLLIALADRIAVMYAGKVVEVCDAAELYRSPRHPYSYGLLNCFPRLHGERNALTGISGFPPDLRKVPTGCSFHPRCDRVMAHCREVVPVLKATGQPGDSQSHCVSCLLYDTATPEMQPSSLHEVGGADGR
jgi:peptide/nickel transport system permease protein